MKSLSLWLIVLSLSAVASADKPAATADTLPATQPMFDASAMKANALSDVVEYVRDLGSVDVYVDWNGLEAERVQRDTLVTLSARKATAAKYLQTVFDIADTGPNKGDVSAVDGILIVALPEKLSRLSTAIGPPDPADKVVGQVRFTATAVADATEFFHDATGLKDKTDWAGVRKSRTVERPPGLAEGPFDPAKNRTDPPGRFNLRSGCDRRIASRRRLVLVHRRGEGQKMKTWFAVALIVGLCVCVVGVRADPPADAPTSEPGKANKSRDPFERSNGRWGARRRRDRRRHRLRP